MRHENNYRSRKKYSNSNSASSGKSVQWTAFNILSTPKRALKLSGRNFFARSGSDGPTNSLQTEIQHLFTQNWRKKRVILSFLRNLQCYFSHLNTVGMFSSFPDTAKAIQDPLESWVTMAGYSGNMVQYISKNSSAADRSKRTIRRPDIIKPLFWIAEIIGPSRPKKFGTHTFKNLIISTGNCSRLLQTNIPIWKAWGFTIQHVLFRIFEASEETWKVVLHLSGKKLRSRRSTSTGLLEA